MSDITQHLLSLRHALPPGVDLVAVSKFHPAEAVAEAYAAGQRVFGESREQELRAKHAALPQDVRWHFIGHLQTNKVRAIAPYVSMIESVDSARLLAEIEKQAAACGRVIDVLLEVHVAREETKSGLAPDELRTLLNDGAWRNMPHIRPRGLMAMASNTDNTDTVCADFRAARQLFDEVKAQHFAHDDNFNVRSWGMSHDWPLAVECGSNHVRVGTYIFGER